MQKHFHNDQSVPTRPDHEPLVMMNEGILKKKAKLCMCSHLEAGGSDTSAGAGRAQPGRSAPAAAAAARVDARQRRQLASAPEEVIPACPLRGNTARPP